MVETLTHLLLQSEGNTSHGSLLNTLHQPGRVSSNLVSKSLCLDQCDIVEDTFIYMEVDGQPKQTNALSY